MKKFFKEIKRIISQFFEREYWYNHRKISHFWFDEDDNKWRDSSYPKNARTIMNCTWEGEWDLWCSMLLKLDHMFWNLKKYGVEANYYFYSGNIDKYANDSDKKILAKKVINSALFNFEKYSKDKNKDKVNIFWLFNIDVDSQYSDNGKAGFYLKYSENSKKLYLTSKTNEKIPANQIKKKNKLYTIDSYIDKNGKKQWAHTEADQYRQKFGEVLETWNLSNIEEREDFILNNIDILITKRCRDYAKEAFDVDIEDNVDLMQVVLNRLDQCCPSFEIEEIPFLSKELRNYATGNFVKCRDILHLRRLIKKLLETSEDDMKYDYLFINESDEDKRNAGFKEAIERYNADREAAYKRVMDFMREKSQNWWD